jgi:rSAM/selenodomain-associated transferase 1
MLRSTGAGSPLVTATDRAGARASHGRSPDALVFMAKWPEPGRAKTRLTPPLTPGEAAALARCFLLDMLHGAATTGADRYLAFAPLSAAGRFRRLAGPNVALLAAEAPHLGRALCAAQRSALGRGHARVALVGADLPHLPPECYGEAFAALEGADVVIGPSSDGGYYLLASRRETPELFTGVAWSTPAVLEQTLARTAAVGLRAALITPCDDVDTAADLPPLLAALRARPGAGHTLALLERLRSGGVSDPRLTGGAGPVAWPDLRPVMEHADV